MVRNGFEFRGKCKTDTTTWKPVDGKTKEMNSRGGTRKNEFRGSRDEHLILNRLPAHKPTINCTLRSSFLVPLNVKNSLKTALYSTAKPLAVMAMSMENSIGVVAAKLGMMSFFKADDKVVPLFVIGFKEGYDAVQVGLTVTFRRSTQSRWATSRNSNSNPPRVLS
ncbi:hypothetical protein TIFTF001_023877 [Ficus carica]|uniref:Uncharacterized protein n=1 Tax=Ficus carica TaxID=3494 RepID=A0AA88DFM9_FICCA|nr:hypothetical protein TIFTF001_023877 [Ficus carica]